MSGVKKKKKKKKKERGGYSLTFNSTIWFHFQVNCNLKYRTIKFNHLLRSQHQNEHYSIKNNFITALKKNCYFYAFTLAAQTLVLRR